MHATRRIRLGAPSLLMIFSLLGVASLTFAADKDIVRVQGTLMVLEPDQARMVVNEKTFFWNQKTGFFDEKGSSISVDQLGVRTWVYVVAERDPHTKRAVLEKVYRLPKYIDAKERPLYPFIQ